jgi:hypothetical protein
LLITRYVWITNFQNWMKKKIPILDLNTHFSVPEVEDFLRTAVALHVRIWCQKGLIYLAEKKTSPRPLPVLLRVTELPVAMNFSDICKIFWIYFKLLACSYQNLCCCAEKMREVKVRCHKLPWGCLKECLN